MPTGKPFEQGDKRINRRGRPKKGQSLTDILNYTLDQKDEKSGKLRREVIAEKLLALAESGDVMAIRYVMDRIDGKPRETINAEVKGRIMNPEAIMQKLMETLST